MAFIDWAKIENLNLRGMVMRTEKRIDLRDLPEYAQQEVYDFYLLIKQRVLEKRAISGAGESALLSEKCLAEDWDRPEEDEAWQAFQ